MKREKKAELRNDREKIASFVVGFLKSFRQAVLPYMRCRNEKTSNEEIECLLAHMQIFSVRALETLFRDCFIVLCRLDESFLKKAMLSAKGKLDYESVYQFMNGEERIEEHLSENFNFQNLDVVSSAFSPLWGKSFFEAMNEEPFHPCVPYGPPYMVKIDLKKIGWEKALYSLFESRHSIIHNANAALPIDDKGVVFQAEIALMIGQLFAARISSLLDVGVICSEVPVWVGMYWAALSKGNTSPEELMLKYFEEIAPNPSLRDAKMNMGPAVVNIEQLLEIKFLDAVPTHEVIGSGKSVSHNLESSEEGLMLTTLIEVNQEL